METQSNKLTWNKQVEINKRENFSLSYTTPKVGKNKPANKARDYNPKDGEQCSNNKISILNNITIS